MTPKGRAVQVWANIQRRCNNADGRHPSYASIGCDISKPEFMKWAVATLTEFWRVYPGLTPELDRIDPSRNYTLSNIRWLTPFEHRKYGRKKTAIRIKSQTGREYHLDYNNTSLPPLITFNGPPVAPLTYGSVKSVF